MSLKAKKLQMQELFSPLSPSEAILMFAPCPGVFEYSVIVVYKGGKLILVDLLQSAERQKLVMVTHRVNFNYQESQSVADSVTEMSDAGERKFLVAVSPSQFVVVYEQAAKLYQIVDFDIKLVKEYAELIPDDITYLSLYHTGKKGLTHLAVGTDSSSQVVLFNIKTEVIDKTLDVDEESVTSVFEVGQNYIACTTLNGHLCLWDKNTHINIMKDKVMEAIYIVTKIPNTDLYAIGGQGPLLIYDIQDRAVEVKIKGLSGGVVDIVYSDAAKMLVFGDEGGTIYTYSLESLLANYN